MDRLSNPCKQVSELLALETNFRIICPEWLRERLLDRLKRVFSANSGDEKTV